MSVPCGKCTACRIARAREWSTRLIHELGFHDKAVFVTLTYNDENLPEGGTLVKRDLQLFFKRLRKKVDVKLKYYGSGEYGDRFGRPHYHLILFGLGVEDQVLLESTWAMGIVHVGTVTYDSCRYTADYIMKKYDGKKGREVYGSKERPFAVISKAIGKDYCLGESEHITSRMGCTIRGVEVGVPRYYKKVLDMDKDLLRAQAMEAFEERRQVFARRAGDDLGTTQEMLNTRAQVTKKLKRKSELYSKGTM